MKFKLILSKKAQKDLRDLSPKLSKKFLQLLVEVICEDPFLGKKLLGDLKGVFSYRLSFKDRILYEVDTEENLISVLRCKTHYGE